LAYGLVHSAKPHYAIFRAETKKEEEVLIDFAHIPLRVGHEDCFTSFP
jgi:hypothetical protein